MNRLKHLQFWTRIDNFSQKKILFTVGEITAQCTSIHRLLCLETTGSYKTCKIGTRVLCLAIRLARRPDISWLTNKVCSVLWNELSHCERDFLCVIEYITNNLFFSFFTKVCFTYFFKTYSRSLSWKIVNLFIVYLSHYTYRNLL